MVSFSFVMRPYRTYAVLAFLLYLCVVAVFHFQLHRNLGLKYAAFREESDRKLDGALKKIEVLNRRIQDLSRIPAYRTQPFPISQPMTNVAPLKVPVRPEVRVKKNPVVNITDKELKKLYWKTNYDFSRPRMHHCRNHATNSFSSLGKIFIYSAYYDNRNSTPHIRVMALLPLRYRMPVQCEFQQKNETYKTPLEYYEMCENHARQFGGFILSCEVPANLIQVPCSVTVTSNISVATKDGQANQRINTSGISVPVLASPTSTPRKRFAICVPPIFGSIKQRLMVEFIEMNLLLGVQHFNFYTFQVNSDMQKILDYYENMGVVTQIHWNLPVGNNKVWYNGQLLTINDCLYRHMNHFDYIGFHDMDELMVPHGQYRQWSDLLDDLRHEDVNDTIAGYVFPSAFFDITNRSKPGKVPETYFTSELQRKLIFSQVRTKCLVRPTRIFELGIHHVSRTFAPHYDVARLKEDQGYLHHYRKCVTEFDPRMKCGSTTADNHLSTFGSTLRARSARVMQKIFKHMAKLIS